MRLDQGRLSATKLSLGPNDIAIQADASKLSDLDYLFAKLQEEGFEYLDALFVNVGLSHLEPFASVMEETFDRMVAVNLKGAFFTVQKALPFLRPGSSVILDASVVARKGWPNCTVVSAMKSGLVSLAKTMSSELVTERGIRVNTLSPGPADTIMFERIPEKGHGNSVKAMHEGNPSRRIARPE